MIFSERLNLLSSEIHKNVRSKDLSFAYYDDNVLFLLSQRKSLIKSLLCNKSKSEVSKTLSDFNVLEGAK